MTATMTDAHRRPRRTPKSQALRTDTTPRSPIAVPTGPRQPSNLDDIAARWRLALIAAEEALRASSPSEIEGLSFTEIARRRQRLDEEWLVSAKLLAAVARQTGTRLRRSLSAPRATVRMLGLPAGTTACLFDLDGVLTPTARLHAEAWAKTFDELLARHACSGETFAHLARPFDPRHDYFAYLHGRPRLDGVQEFLASRAISLPRGKASDSPGAESVHGMANRKNEVLQHLLEREGVDAFDESRRYLEGAREAGVRCAVVSASANTRAILARAGLDDLVDQIVDGTMIRSAGLGAKPAPDVLLAACDALHVQPAQAASFETTEAGIAAARSAGVGTIVGVDHMGQLQALRAASAALVVGDLAVLLRKERDGL
jgi:beta-phosphoglucomutase family hydrolase